MEIKLKQRIIGIVVLGALAVIFIPLFFKGYNQASPQQNAIQQIPNPPPPPTPPSNLQTSQANNTPQLAYDNNATSQPQATTQPVSMTPSSSANAASTSPSTTNPTPVNTVPNATDNNTKNNSSGVVTSKNQVVNSNPVVADSEAPSAAASNAAAPAKPVVAIAQINTGSAASKPKLVKLTPAQQARLDALNNQLDTTLVETVAKPSNTSVSKSSIAATKFSAGKAYAIQVGTFSNTQNADKLIKQLETHGFKAYTAMVTTSKGKMTRVIVGPIDQNAKAKATIAALDQQLHIKGNLISPIALEQPAHKAHAASNA